MPEKVEIEFVSRRSALLTAARWTVAAGMFGVAGVMLKQGFELEDCFGHRMCNTCIVHSKCELPYPQPKKVEDA